MIRLSKLADYGIVMMTNMARHPQRQHNAAGIAAESHIPLPMASKILKALARAGLLASHRGAKGGYGLAREAEAITVAEVNDAPVLTPIGPQAVNEETLLAFTVTASDPNDDPNNLNLYIADGQIDNAPDPDLDRDGLIYEVEVYPFDFLAEKKCRK